MTTAFRERALRWLVRACVAAIASLGATEAHAQEPLKLWHAYGGAEEDAIRQAARAFEQAHGIEVEILANAFGAYGSKLESAIPTGQGPDVFIDAHERLASYLERSLIAPIEGSDVTSFSAEDLSALTDGGALYGIPLATKTAAVYLNRACYPGAAPATFEALLETPSACDATYPLVFEAENAYYVAALLHAHGGRLLNDDGTYGFVGDAAHATVRFVRDAVRARSIPEEANGELVSRLFSGGQAAAAISGPWMAPGLPEDLQWRVVPMPPLRSGGAVQPFSTIEAAFVTSHTERPEARSLAEFLAGPVGAEIRARVGRQVVAFAGERGDDEVLATFRSAAAAAIPMPTHPRMRQVFEPARGALLSALRQGTPIDAALADGAADFADATRPMPEAVSPTPTLLALGAFLLFVVFVWVRRLQDPETRVAIRRSMPAYRYLIHAFVAVGLLVLLPLLVGAGASLFAGRGTDMHFVGFANYVDILSARGGDLLGRRSFYVVLLVTVLWTVVNIALHLGIGMALALLLHRPTLKLRGFYRVVLILPWAVPSYVTALAWKGMFHRQLGAINAMLEGLGVEPVSWFAQWSTAFTANVATNVWLGFPFMMVVTLGALTSIPNELYEAAEVDGATSWQKFRRVTLPMLRPALGPAVAMGAVWTFNMFNVVFLVSAGEPGGRTEILVSEAYRWAFTRGSQYGYAAAYAVLIFGILLVSTRLFGASRKAAPA